MQNVFSLGKYHFKMKMSYAESADLREMSAYALHSAKDPKLLGGYSTVNGMKAVEKTKKQ